MKIVCTVEARMTSSRLPGKVLLPVLGKPMLHHLVTRLRAAPSIDEIVLATTVNAADDRLAGFAKDEHIRCFRGSEDDVMARVVGAAESAAADVVVEITGDCPLVDPQIIERCIGTFKANDTAYVGNALVRSYPDGMDVQVFPLEMLRRSAAMTNDPRDREHVTLHIRNHPELFPHRHVMAESDIHWPELGLTLDEYADYELLKRVIEHFGSENTTPACREIVHLLRANPEWLAINESVQRKANA
jgi:spore coat polysaccharide biosynthesis protein SpsF